MHRKMAKLFPFALAAGFGLTILLPIGQAQKSDAPQIPKVWDEAALAEWATPVAGLNVRPGHMSAKEYYALTVENLKTYPIYLNGKEPEGYWEMLNKVGPQPLIEPEKLKTEADWIGAGRRVFYEADHLQLRSYDPELIAAARKADAISNPLNHSVVSDLRWVPTNKGVALTMANCSRCHTQYLPDGTLVSGAPGFGGQANTRLINPLQLSRRVLGGAPPFHMGPESSGPLFYGPWLYQAYGVPWVKNDIHERVKTLTREEYLALNRGVGRGGGFPRWNGSLYYAAKMPDLIGLKEHNYLDHTATHLHRNIGDLMRYAALVSFADSANFGPHHMLTPETKRATVRLPDEALYALALYIYSLEPPKNPNPFDEKAKAGQAIFARERCTSCHTPPLYTNNKLTLAEGFTPPKNAPATLDVMPLSVGTDPGSALGTRKGTGYYKVPSLKGVWYRGHYLHDGAAASLEEMFNPDRLTETYVPGGFIPPGAKTRAIKGHEFGLRLPVEEKQALIAFLKTL
jgi:mono/diheme cytochrome c family protein